MSDLTFEQLLERCIARNVAYARFIGTPEKVIEAREAVLEVHASVVRERDEARAAAEKEFDSVMALSAERDAVANQSVDFIAAMGREWQKERAALTAERDAYRADAERYEIIRCMVPRQFQDAWTLNLRTGKPFDEIIDDLRPFAAIAQRGEKGS